MPRLCHLFSRRHSLDTYHSFRVLELIGEMLEGRRAGALQISFVDGGNRVAGGIRMGGGGSRG